MPIEIGKLEEEGVEKIGTAQVKILEFLNANPDSAFDVDEVAASTGCAKNTVLQQSSKLHALEKIQRKLMGRKIYLGALPSVRQGAPAPKLKQNNNRRRKRTPVEGREETE